MPRTCPDCKNATVRPHPTFTELSRCALCGLTAPTTHFKAKTRKRIPQLTFAYPPDY